MVGGFEALMAWFRMESSFAQHRKIRQLARLLGIDIMEARGAIVGLLCRVCEEAPDGCLAGWDDFDIADAAGWNDKPNDFTQACKTVRLIVDGDSGPEINDWMVYAEGYKRAQRAKKLRELKTSGTRSARVVHASGTRSARVPQTDGRTDGQDGQDGPDKTPMSKSADDAVRQIWNHYRTHHKSAAKVLRSGRKEYRLIKQRLADGYTVDDLKRCIDGYHKSPHHLGDNDRGTKYLSAELFFRDASHVQRGIEFADGSGKADTGPVYKTIEQQKAIEAARIAELEARLARGETHDAEQCR